MGVRQHPLADHEALAEQRILAVPQFGGRFGQALGLRRRLALPVGLPAVLPGHAVGEGQRAGQGGGQCGGQEQRGTCAPVRGCGGSFGRGGGGGWTAVHDGPPGSPAGPVLIGGLILWRGKICAEDIHSRGLPPVRRGWEVGPQAGPAAGRGPSAAAS
ncbi:hypothetical protein GCM10009526_21060 [Glutamicibacter creatinolyticus]